jgi:hypothetical protein
MSEGLAALGAVSKPNKARGNRRFASSFDIGMSRWFAPGIMPGVIIAFARIAAQSGASKIASKRAVKGCSGAVAESVEIFLERTAFMPDFTGEIEC